jgi:thiol-disulfide isomerase/thioredoxin
MPSNNNSKSMKMSMPKSRQSWAVIGVLVLLFALVIALYHMRKSNSKEGFETDDDNSNVNSNVNSNSNSNRKMSEKFIDTSIKPNLTPATGEYVVALFYADWCPHCQHFKPDFMKAMKLMNGTVGKNGKKLRLEMVDCEVHKELGREYDVSGYPTVKLIKDDGTQVEYSGERNFEGLRKFLVSDD